MPLVGKIFSDKLFVCKKISTPPPLTKKVVSNPRISGNQILTLYQQPNLQGMVTGHEGLEGG
jgi:hypothetical protein